MHKGTGVIANSNVNFNFRGKKRQFLKAELYSYFVEYGGVNTDNIKACRRYK